MAVKLIDIFFDKYEKRESVLDEHAVPFDLSTIGYVNLVPVYYSSSTGKACVFENSAHNHQVFKISYQQSGQYQNDTQLNNFDLSFKNGPLIIKTTNICNAKCPYCYAQQEHDKKNSTISFETVKKAVDLKFQLNPQHIDIGFFGGGEPTIALDLIKETCYYVKQKFKSHMLSTQSNGVIPPNNLEWFCENLTAIRISCDGPKEIQNIQRPLADGGPSSEIVEHTLKRLLDAAKQEPMVTSIITEYSVKKQEDILNYFHELGVKEVSFCPVVKSNNGFFSEASYAKPPNFEEFANYYLKTKELADDYGMSLTVHQITHPERLGLCGSKLYLLQDGNISVCPRALGSNTATEREFIVGGVNKTCGSVDSTKWKKILGTNPRQTPSCNDCLVKFNCRGSCMFEASIETGDITHLNKSKCECMQKIANGYIRYSVAKQLLGTHEFLEKKESGLHYKNFFSEYKLEGANTLRYGRTSNRNSGFFITLQPKENFQELSESIIKVKKENFPHQTLFLISPRLFHHAESNHVKGFIAFLKEIKKKGVWFKITRPLHLCGPMRGYLTYAKEVYAYNVPVDCEQCLELFVVLSDGRLKFCNGSIASKCFKEYASKKEIVSEFFRTIKKVNTNSKCNFCYLKLRGTCTQAPCHA